MTGTTWEDVKGMLDCSVYSMGIVCRSVGDMYSTRLPCIPWTLCAVQWVTQHPSPLYPMDIVRHSVGDTAPISVPVLSCQALATRVLP